MAEIHSPQATATDIRRGYDDPPTNVKGFAVFLVCFILFCAGVLVLIWVMLNGMEKVEQAKNVEVYGAPPIAFTRQLSFPEPQLQPSPGHVRMDWKDMEVLKEKQQETLGATTRPGYAFTRDHKTDPLRIPEPLVAAVGSLIAQLRNPPPTTMPAGAEIETPTGATPAAAPTGATLPSGEAPKAPSEEEKPRDAQPGSGEAKQP